MTRLTRNHKFENKDIGRKIMRVDEYGFYQTGVITDWITGIVIIKWNDVEQLEEIPDYKFSELYLT